MENLGYETRQPGTHLMNATRNVFKTHLQEHRLLYAVGGSVFILMLCVALTYWGNFPFQLSNSQEVWGQFGDYFGGVLNPILSFAAFVILLITFRQQIFEGKSAKANHEESLANQRFYALISLTHEAARSVEIDIISDDKSVETFQNHRAVGRSWNILRRRLKVPTEQHSAPSLADFMEEYRSWRMDYWQSVGSYFESVLFVLWNYVLDVDGSIEKFDDLEKSYFMFALRAQMSMNERNLLFFEMLCSDVWRAHLPVLQRANFWRGGGDGLDPFRNALIEQALAQSTT